MTLPIRVRQSDGSIPSVSEPAEAAPDLKQTRRQKESAKAPEIDRLPPHAPDAEQGIIGCLLLSPNECMGECIEKFNRSHSEVFFDLRHQSIFDVMMEMYDKREEIDVITLSGRLKDKGVLEQVGGIAYLAAAIGVVPSAANLDYYLEHVWEKYKLRKTIQLCAEISNRVYEHTGTVDEFMSIAEREFSKLFSIDNSSSKQLTIKEAVKAALVKIETLHAKKGAAGLSTGLPDLDRMTCGLHNADMIVIGARPSTGKTSLGWGIAEHVAIEHNLPVGVFSLEMSTESLVMRALCSLGKVDSQHVRTGDLIESDFTKLAAAASKLAKAPIYIDDTAGLNLSAMRSKALRWHQLYGIKLLVIDYLQLLQVLSQRRGDNRQQEVAMISNGVKALAKELDIPIIVLAQLNRDMDKTAGKKSGPRKPRMSDLRESGAIEQDADLIGLLWKTETEDEEEEHSASDVVPVRLTIAKQRNGPTGDIDLAFLRSYTRFESAAKGGPIE